jgi:N-acetylglucosaminyltransferase
MTVTTTAVTVVLPLYLAIVPAYSRLQRRFAQLGRRPRAGSPESSPRRASYRPSVDVVIPCYNEDPHLLAACLRSLRGQDYKGAMRVWVVDDGSGNREALRPVLEAVSGLDQRVLLLDGNHGKREAQAAALREGSGDVVVTIDSNTTIAPDGIRRIVAQLGDPRVGAVTADLRASNADTTWLTRLIDVRYRLLFERERAAQSYFGTVFCCAGPFSAYRREAVEQVLPQYLSQRFCGRRRVFGDDLTLTNLVLAAGYESVYEPAAAAVTSVPTTLRRFARQQLRWNRSFYRELPQMLRLLRGRSRYLAFDLAARTLLPALVATGIAGTVADALTAASRVPLDLGVLAIMAIATVDLGLTPAGREGRRFAVGYGLVFVGLLLPIRLWALCTLFQNHWGTRELKGQWRTRASSLRAFISPTSLPFSRYRVIARSSSLAASPLRPARPKTSARSTRASARESS